MGERSRSSGSGERAGIAPTRTHVLFAAAVFLLVTPFAHALDLSRQVAFDIPAQPLSAALIEFSHQARVQIIVRDDISGQMTRGITGSHPLDEALRLLLGSSGLIYRVASDTSIVIAHAGNSASSTTRGEGVPARKPIAASGRFPLGAGADQTSHRAAAESGGTQQETSGLAAEDAPVLQQIVVLGSLLPSTRLETSSPVIIISADEIKERGFTSVADALQNLSANTGSINNTAISTGDIWAAKTLSLFGLDPSYTKFLIDGRPMPNFSQMFQENLAEVLITNLSAIPIDLVDRIEILPGSASSLYGSDAIAGVVNIVLKKHARLATIDASYGWYGLGGGTQKKLSLSTSFDRGNWSVLLGAQIMRQQPMWDFQRSITAQTYDQGPGPYEPRLAAYVLNLFQGSSAILDPGNCAGLSRLWGGTVRPVTTESGSYCGTSAGNSFGNLMNRDDVDSISAQITYTANVHLQLYADVLETYEAQAHAVASDWSASYLDPVQGGLMTAVRFFAPEEEAPSLDRLLNQSAYENTLMATLGAKGDFAGGWTYDFSATLSRESLDNRQTGLYGNDEPNSFGSYFLGPQLGAIPTEFSNLPIYAADYSRLYTPITPAQFDAFTARGSINSSSRDDVIHAEVTQPALFPLPGGDAGLAMIAEAGHETWDYLPDQVFTSGVLNGLTWNVSSGRRSRYAAAGEIKLPIIHAITIDGSTRFDGYDVEGTKFSRGTYSAGVEFRPVRSILIRGKYGTGFKAPSLIDEFEGTSTSNTFVADYLNCGRLGYSGSDIAGCPNQYSFEPVTNRESSNRGLKPITTQSLSYGVVWSPLASLALSVDYQRLAIDNEVLNESTNYLLQNEWLCANGTIASSSPTCAATASQIVRGPATPGSPLAGPLSEIITTKINLAREVSDSLSASLQYNFDVPVVGHFRLDARYTDILKHTQQTYPGDPILDLLNQPGYSQEFKSKVNAAITWSRKGWQATVYGTRFGRTPNFAAYSVDTYSAPGAGLVRAWYLWNASLAYTYRALTLSLLVNNVGNSMPPHDRTYPDVSNVPFVDGDYNPYGRQFVLEGKYEFGDSRAR